MQCTHVILYDGLCGFCNQVVRFVPKRDRDSRFCYASHPRVSPRFGRSFSRVWIPL
jgi:predicted DCC family thiol-disulfide oxidoreductase YuxK